MNNNIDMNKRLGMNCGLFFRLAVSISIVLFIIEIADSGELSGYSLSSVEHNLVYKDHLRWQKSIISPASLAVDSSGNLYVIETKSDSLFVYNKDGKLIRELEGLDGPVSVAVDKTGRVYIGNLRKSNVSVYDSRLSYLFKLGSGDGEFGFPSSIAVDGSLKIYVSDSQKNTVKIYGYKGDNEGLLGGPGIFYYPTSIAVNKKTGDLIVSDFVSMDMANKTIGRPRIQVVNREGNILRSFWMYGTGEGKKYKRMDVSVDSSGKIYVLDSLQNVIQIFDSSGRYLALMYDLNNPFRIPTGITINEDDMLFVSSLNMGLIEVSSLTDEKTMSLAKINNTSDIANIIAQMKRPLY